MASRPALRQGLGWLLAILVVGCADRCSDPDQGAADEASQDIDGPPFVLAWDVTHPRWGTEWILVRADGRARYLLDPPKGREGSRLRGETTFDRARLRDLGGALLEADACTGTQRDRVSPEESQPTLKLDFNGLECEATRWYGEWQASAVWPILEDLRRTLRTAALFPNEAHAPAATTAEHSAAPGEREPPDEGGDGAREARADDESSDDPRADDTRAEASE